LRRAPEAAQVILERREFLRLIGGAGGALTLGSCSRFSVPERLVKLALRGPGLESQVNTVCGLCEGGCGVTVRLVDGLPVGLKGNPRHPLNRGGLCPVGLSGLEVLYAPSRLQGPLRRQPDGSLRDVGWDEALDELAERLGGLLEAGQGDKLAICRESSGQLLGDLADRFLTACGSARSWRRESSAVLPFRLAQGLDGVPGFDLAGADLVLSVGLDLFEDGPAPVHSAAALVGSRATAERGRLIHVGTRLSPSATKADDFIAVRPGAHAAVALGIAHVLVREGRYDRRFVAEHTFGFEDWTDESGRQRLGFKRLLLERYYPDRAARLAGCESGEIIAAARRLARARSPLAVCGGEALGDSNATGTGLAVHAVNALLGAFNRPGGVMLAPPIPFSPLPALATEGGDRTEAVGSADALAALASDEDTELLFLLGTNPVQTSPLGEELRRVLERIPFVVSFASFRDETAAHADLVLPASSWLEAAYDSTTPSGVPFSVFGLSQPTVDAFYDTRHPGDAILAVAARVGSGVAAALPWKSFDDYVDDRLQGLVSSGQGAAVSGSFEESWVHFLEERGWRFLEHGDRGRFRRDVTRAGGWWNPIRAGEDWARMFRTPSGRYEFFSRELERRLREVGAAGEGGSVGDDALQRGVEALGLEVSGDVACLPHFESQGEQEEGELRLVPFRPITGRGNVGVESPMVLEMFGYAVLSGWQTWVELAPETAHEQHLEEGDRVEVVSDRGAVEAVVKIQPGNTPGVAHMPLGLGRSSTGGAAEGVGENPLALVTAGRDPLSGAATTTGTRVQLRLLARRARGGARPLTGGHG
jgi:anaerobic selenocysteine-containing dehydrogenase